MITKRSESPHAHQTPRRPPHSRPNCAHRRRTSGRCHALRLAPGVRGRPARESVRRLRPALGIELINGRRHQRCHKVALAPALLSRFAPRLSRLRTCGLALLPTRLSLHPGFFPCHPALVALGRTRLAQTIPEALAQARRVALQRGAQQRGDPTDHGDRLPRGPRPCESRTRPTRGTSTRSALPS